MMAEKDESYITSREAASQLGLSLRTIQLWVENGVLSAWKTAGGHRRIAKSSVDALLKERESELQQRPSGNPFTLVVVEDDPHMIALYRQQINEWDLPIHVITANNGYEGLLQIGQWSPQLVITDLDMPGMDGLSMIHALRDKPELGHTQIVIVTGLRPDEIKERGYLPNDIFVFMKPVDFDQLEKLVREHVDQHMTVLW